MAKSKNVKKIKNPIKDKEAPANPNMPAQAKPEDTYRSIRYKADVKTLVVRTEIGYDLVFDLIPQVRVNPYEGTEQGTPKFQTSIVWSLKGARPRGNAMKLSDIEKTIKSRSLLPDELDYDIAQLGFVYSNARDLNNHRWWLEALKAGKSMGQFDSLLSEYAIDVLSTAPIGSRAWFDGIHHGRFTFAKDTIEKVTEEGKNRIKINGNGKGRIGEIKPNVEIPETCKFLRLRFDVRKNHWYVELLDPEGKMLQQLISTNIKSDAKFKGHIMPDPNRPKVSGLILRENVTAIKTDDKLTMIKGIIE